MRCCCGRCRSARPTGFTLTGNGDPAFTLGQVVTPNFLDVLGVQPMLGRTFRPDETEAGRHRVAILTHALWQQHCGADPSIVVAALRR